MPWWCNPKSLFWIKLVVWYWCSGRKKNGEGKRIEIRSIQSLILHSVWCPTDNCSVAVCSGEKEGSGCVFTLDRHQKENKKKALTWNFLPSCTTAQWKCVWLLKRDKGFGRAKCPRRVEQRTTSHESVLYNLNISSGPILMEQYIDRALSGSRIFGRGFHPMCAWGILIWWSVGPSAGILSTVTLVC